MQRNCNGETHTVNVLKNEKKRQENTWQNEMQCYEDQGKNKRWLSSLRK